MGRPRKEGRQIAVRLSDELLARVDARVASLKAKGGLFESITRSDVIREAVAAQIGEVVEPTQASAKT